jgi:hypothetical protein
MNPVDQLRDGKCKLCWGLWLHPKKVEDNGAHKYGECRGARCGRCGELADHYEKNCAETGLPLAQMWPAFPGMAAKQVLENNFAGERADNKGKEFSWWKSAVKRCTSDKKGEEGAKYLVDQAREREERENVATAKEDAKSQAVAAKVSKAKAKEANPTPFTLPYPITTLRDIPKTSMEAYRTVTYNLDTGNPDKTVTSRNEFRNSFQNGAKAQTIKDLIDGYLTEADKQKITKNVFENVFEPRQNIASRYDGALKSDWEESEPRVFSNHFPLHIGDGVKLFYYTVTLKATKAEKAKKEMKAKEEEKDEHTDEGNADLPNPGNPKPKLGEPHPDLSDFNGQLQSGFLPKINQNSVVKKNQTYSSSPASDGHGRGLGPPAGMLPYRPAPKHPSMSDGKIAGTIYGSSPAVPSKAKGKQPAPSNKTSAGEQSRSEDETLILDNLNLDANLENATSESVGAGTDESTPRSSRAIKRMVISQLLRQCNELQQNANHLATDFIQTIVSWKDLFPDAQSDEVYQGTVHLRPESAKNKKTFQVTIKRQDTIALDTFKQHVEGVVTQAAITCNTSKIAELLSIFVSRHVSQNAGYSEYETPINESRQSTTKGAGKLKSDVPVERSEYTFKQIGTKYFATEQFKTLDCDERDNVTPLGTAFCAMRGFNTNIVSGMGQAFLNVNVCASAFFKCLTVAQFFDLFAAESTLELGKRLLSRVRVYIVEDRKGTFLNDASARIKTIQSFEREENIPTFKDKKTKMDTTVKDYLLNSEFFFISLRIYHANCNHSAWLGKGFRFAICQRGWLPRGKAELVPTRKATHSTVPAFPWATTDRSHLQND